MESVKTILICPDCERRASEMQVTAERYEPTPADLAKRRWAGWLPIGQQILLCPCGRKNTWFSLLGKALVEEGKQQRLEL